VFKGIAVLRVLMEKGSELAMMCESRYSDPWQGVSSTARAEAWPFFVRPLAR